MGCSFITTVREATNALLKVREGPNIFSSTGCLFNQIHYTVIKDVMCQPRWSYRQEKTVNKILGSYATQLKMRGIIWKELQFETNENDVPIPKVEASYNGPNDLSLAEIDGRQFLILKSPKSFKDKAKEVPHCIWMPEQRVHRYPVLDDVLEAFEPMIKSREVRPSLDVYKLYNALKTSKPVKDQIKEIKQGKVPPIPVPLKSEPYNHQKIAFASASLLPQFGLFMEQGTGKSMVAVAVAGHRYLRKQVKRLLVIAPLSVIPVWGLEFKKHANFAARIVPLGSEYDLDDKRRILKQWKDSDGLQVIVINYESSWRLVEELAKWVAGGMIILDESQKIKNAQAKQTKGCINLSRVAPYRMILTGTPVTEGPTDFFSQFKFLNKSIFGSSFRKFQEEYCTMGGFQHREVVSYKNLEKLAERAHSIGFRCTKAECLDLPEAVDQIQYCYMNEGKKIYDDMNEEMVAVVQGKKITAPIVLAQILRLQQITGGFLPKRNQQGEVQILETGKEKLNLLQSVVEDFTKKEKIVIFARFIPEIKAIEQLMKRMGRNPVLLYGDTKDRGKVVADFQGDSSVDTIIIQIQTGGLGITLTAASIAIFYSMSYSYADYEQAKARIHRIGQTKSVTYIHLIAKNTIDEDVFDAVKGKRDVAQLVVDKYKGYIVEKQ